MDHFIYISLIQGSLLLLSSNCFAQKIEIEDGGLRQVQGNSNPVVTCYAIDLPASQDPQLRWVKPDGEPVTTDSSQSVWLRVTQPPDVTQLQMRINSIQKSMAGSYRCIGIVNGVDVEDTITFEVSTPIITDSIERNQDFDQGNDVVVRCQFDSNDFSISWFDNKNQVVVPGNPRMSQVPEGLKINNITTADTGTYYCEVSTSRDFKKVAIKVVVNVIPSIYNPPSRQEAIVGMSMRMDCKASGLPQPVYQWFKVGQNTPLTDGDRFEIDDQLGHFIIRDVIIDDAGTYRCIARNKAGTEAKEAELDVLIPPSIEELNNMTANEDSSVSLRCVVSGHPLPSVQWQKEGNDFRFNVGNQDVDGNSGDDVSVKTSLSQTDEVDLRRRTSVLIINNLIPSDGGKYDCMAHTENAGSVQDASYLTVRYKPRVAKNQRDREYSWAGHTGTLMCTVLGEPIAKISWLINGVVIQQGQTYYDQTSRQVDSVTVEGILMVRVDFGNQDEAFTKYTCEARNDMGVTSYNITLVKASVPVLTKVSELELTPGTARYSVEVSAVNNGPPPTAIEVEYNGTVKMVPISMNGPTIVEMTNLRGGTQYTFTFYARSEAGRSPAEIKVVATPAMRRPYPVTIQSPSISQKSVEYRLQWDIPKSGGSPISRYDISYRQVNVLPKNKTVTNEYQFLSEVTGWYEVKNIPQGTTTHMIKNLIPSRYYEVKVTATNIKGTSDPKSFIFRTQNKMALSPSDEDLDLSIGIIILIVVVVFVVLFVIVDVTCYFRNKCGVIMCLKERVGHAGSADTRSKEPIMESGESEKGTLPIGGVQNKDQHLVEEDEKKVPLLDSEGGAKDEVEEENEVVAKEAEEIEPEDKPVEEADTKPVVEAEEVKDEPAPAPEVTEDTNPPAEVAATTLPAPTPPTPPAPDAPAELPTVTEPSA